MKPVTLLSFAVLLAGIITQSHAQQPDRFYIAAESQIFVDGTSNLHDWTMEAETIEGYLESNLPNPQDSLPAMMTIELSKVTVPAKGIKNDSRGMVKKTREALEANQFPIITYELQQVDLTNARVNMADSTAGGVVSYGDLTVKNTTRFIQVPLSITGKAEYINVEGSFTMDMTDYEVDPPSALFGAVKSAERITIRFNLMFKPENDKQVATVE